jgi:aspartyl-tRNA(Asn)/glutamyl-tRNA(Gln) amidotransferase subunit A
MTSTISSISLALRDGSTTSEALVEAALHSADEQSHLNAFISMNADEARAAAATADQERAEGTIRGPLHGIPVAIKDNICTRGLRTTCASRFLQGFVPGYDATVVSRLRDGGAIVFGKTNCDEFAMGSSNENSSFGPVLNPRDNARVPGGSSGGSAAVVAAGIVPLSLGSDTGGSVRQPAALCGVVGVKPTYGRVSRNGLVAFGSSLDQVGPFATDVAGAATLLEVIAGADSMDSTCADRPSEPWSQHLQPSDRPTRVGLPREYTTGLSDAARAALMTPLEAMDNVEIVEVSLPHTTYAIATYYVLASAEASANLARYDGIRYGTRVEPPGADLEEVYVASRSAGFGDEVKRRIMLGTFALSAGYYDSYYGKAQQSRRAIRQDFVQAFEQVDVIASLTAPTTAFELGSKTDDPLSMYLSDIFTVPSSLAGLPAMSLPGACDEQGLPWGLQVLAPHWHEEDMFRFAAALEQQLASGAGSPG